MDNKERIKRSRKRRNEINVRAIEKIDKATGKNLYIDRINPDNPDVKKILSEGKLQAILITWDITKTEIAHTNYFELPSTKCGLLHLAGYNKIFHLLVPECQEQAIKEIKTGEHCVISVCKDAVDSQNTFDLLFQDNSPNPFTIRLPKSQSSVMVAVSEDQDEKLILKIWTDGLEKVIEMPAYYRAVNNLPSLYY